jgi:hypothetical protein
MRKYNKEYNKNRYLKNMTEEELLQRMKDILANYVILNENLELSLRKIGIDGDYWFICLTHIMEEIAIRHGNHYILSNGDFFKIFHIPNPIWPMNKKEIDHHKNNLREGEYLIKYGRYKYLKTVYYDGIIKIFPASYYNDASLNPAITDNELELHIYSDISDIRIKEVTNILAKHRSQFPMEGNIRIGVKSSSDYYVYCLSNILDYRLFGDFEADSYLIITHPREFLIALMKAFKIKLPDWEPKARYIDYIDPILTGIESLSEIKGYFFKHFRYYYQQKYRVICLFPYNCNSLEPIYLELESIKKYCKLVSFEWIKKEIIDQ